MKITLATLEQATGQEVFNQVRDHLLKQNKKSIVDSVCVYRGPDNTKCAAGCLMSDEEYDKKIEGVTWDDLTNDNIPYAHSDLITDLQFLHDNFPVEQWHVQLSEVALTYNLIP